MTTDYKINCLAKYNNIFPYNTQEGNLEVIASCSLTCNWPETNMKGESLTVTKTI